MSQAVAARQPLLGAFGLSPASGGPMRLGPHVLACWAALLPGAGLTLAVAGCGGQAASRPAAQGAAPGAAVPAALAGAPLGPQQQVVAAYTGYWQALGQALDTQNAGPRAGVILASVRDRGQHLVADRRVRDRLGAGRDPVRRPVPHILSVRVTGDRAAVHDCADFSRAGVQSASTGQVVGSLGSPRVNMISTLVLTRGRWLVSNQVPVVLSCVP